MLLINAYMMISPIVISSRFICVSNSTTTVWFTLHGKSRISMVKIQFSSFSPKFAKVDHIPWKFFAWHEICKTKSDISSSMARFFCFYSVYMKLHAVFVWAQSTNIENPECCASLSWHKHNTAPAITQILIHSQRIALPTHAYRHKHTQTPSASYPSTGLTAM